MKLLADLNVGFAMNILGQHSQSGKNAIRRDSTQNNLLVFFFSVFALISMSGCVGLTQAGSSAAKSSTGFTAGLTISSQPASQTVKAGQSATFSVAAKSATTVKYQWKMGGTAISGATSASYITPPTTATQSGETFTVTVSDGSNDTVTSNPATLTVDAAPSSLAASSASLNFSDVNIGARSVLPVVFTNQGSSNITISNVTVAGAGYAAAGVSSGQILAPGNSATLSVTFDPSSAGTLPGTATVTSDAANSPAKIALSGIGVQVVQHSATLSWSASASAVAGYNVYRSNVSGGPYTRLGSALVAATTSADTNVLAGDTYYYVVTAVESSGAESVYSAEVSATIP